METFPQPCRYLFALFLALLLSLGATAQSKKTVKKAKHAKITASKKYYKKTVYSKPGQPRTQKQKTDPANKAATLPGSTTKMESVENLSCVELKVIGQKPAPPLKEKPPSDVIEITPDDLLLRFRLGNNCSRTIYYLSYTVLDKSIAAGFLIYRGKDGQWKTRTEGVLGKDSLTDPYLYRWTPLKAGGNVEFEYSDLSRIEGERSIAIFVNNRPRQEKRIELHGNAFLLKQQ